MLTIQIVNLGNVEGMSCVGGDLCPLSALILSYVIVIKSCTSPSKQG